jgi:hypothetical protein
MPLIFEQSGRLFVWPAPRDAGGTTSCVASRARLRCSSVVFAEFGVPGTTSCCVFVGWLFAGVGVGLCVADVGAEV